LLAGTESRLGQKAASGAHAAAAQTTTHKHKKGQ
jgi:hypothetical protein